MAKPVASALRSDSRVSTVELFFDLVYVFAVTQLSHLLLEHPTAAGALRAAVVLGMVWQVWVYTTWSVNYLDPARNSTRAMLLLVMLGSLLIAAGIPEAYHGRASTASPRTARRASRRPTTLAAWPATPSTGCTR